MPKNILDTLIAVGGISGEYEALTEAEIATAPGAAYSPPEQFANFRVVAARTVQLLGGAPWFFKTFQTSACTLRMPSGNIANNDATDGRIFFIKNDSTATGILTIETSGDVGTGPTSIAILNPGDSVIILHEDSDGWEATSVGNETNTASNVGIAGVGVFKAKVGVDLQFKNVNAGSTKVIIVDDTGNDEIDVDVDPADEDWVLHGRVFG